MPTQPAFPWLQALNLYIMLINLLTFAVMGLDKRLARGGLRRVPERIFWASAWLGGAPGAWLGMRLFHHKTRHTSFRIGFPLLALAQAAVYLFLFR